MATCPARSSVLTSPVLPASAISVSLASIERHPRDVLGRSVAVMGQHGDLLLAAALHHPAGRHAFDRDDGRIAVAAVGHPLLDPAVQHAIFVAADLHPLSAAVGRAAGRLQQQQAFARRGGKEPPASSLFHQEFVIVLRNKAQQRQLEAVLAAGLAVAAAAVAAELREDGDDLVFEVDRDLPRAPFDAERELGCSSARGR